MRARAIRDLAQLSDPNLFERVAEGLGHVHGNATRIQDDARLFHDQKRYRGFQILQAVATEEAAKFLILLDAVRCPRTPTDVFSRQLGRFNDHLSKGIYSECCEWRYGSFGEVAQRIADERAEFYLDGPNDVDWIFRNRIIDGRECAMYVDYAETDNGHMWIAPLDHDTLMGYLAPTVVTLVRNFYAVGFADPKALALVSDVWRPVVMAPEFNRWSDLRPLNYRTLQALDEKGLLQEAAQETYAQVVDYWPFPLHSLDLSQIKVKKDDLQAIQDNWWYHEMGVDDWY